MSSGFHRFYSEASSLSLLFWSSLRGSVSWIWEAMLPLERCVQQNLQQETSFLIPWHQFPTICCLTWFLLSGPLRCPIVHCPALQAPGLQCPGLAGPRPSKYRPLPSPVVFALPPPMGYKNVEVTAHFTRNHNQFNFNLRDASVNRKKVGLPPFQLGFLP